MLAMPDLFQLANGLQIAVPVLSLTAYIPQWRKLLRTRSSRDMSLRTWLIWLLSASFALLYAFVQYRLHGSWPLLISSGTTLLCVLLTLLLVLKYRLPRKNHVDSSRQFEPDL